MELDFNINKIPYSLRYNITNERQIPAVIKKIKDQFSPLGQDTESNIEAAISALGGKYRQLEARSDGNFDFTHELRVPLHGGGFDYNATELKYDNFSNKLCNTLI